MKTKRMEEGEWKTEDGKASRWLVNSTLGFLRNQTLPEEVHKYVTELFFIFNCKWTRYEYELLRSIVVFISLPDSHEDVSLRQS